METRARYVLIGSLTLVFIFAMFAFVYWIKNTGFGQRTVFQIQFEQPVAGLAVGSNVLFNGIRVGAITDLSLDPRDPRRLIASIAVDPATPVRADTKVDVTYQGFTGAPALMLKGGSIEAPPLPATDKGPPVLIAGPDVGQSLADAARTTLYNLDDILAENAKPLHTAITGISTFADMLGRNSKRLEDVIAGLERLTGAGPEKKPPAVYDLTAPAAFPSLDKTIKGQLVVSEPNAILLFDSQRIIMRATSGTYSNIADAQWADNLPKLVQARIVQSFENAHQPASRSIEQLAAQYRLELGIRDFQISLAPTPTAVVELSARLLDDKGDVVGAHTFSAAVPAKSADAGDAVAALDAAFSKAATELVSWTVGLSS